MPNTEPDSCPIAACTVGSSREERNQERRCDSWLSTADLQTYNSAQDFNSDHSRIVATCEAVTVPQAANEATISARERQGNSIARQKAPTAAPKITKRRCSTPFPFERPVEETASALVPFLSCFLPNLKDHDDVE